MANPAMSNRAKRELRKGKAKAPRRPKPGQTVTSPKVVKLAVENMGDKDGLTFLLARNRLNPTRARWARAYRKAFREAAGGGATLRSGLDIREGGGGPSAMDGHATKVVSTLDAQRRLFRMRFSHLSGQADLLEVLDGVCGRGLTLRELAGGDGHKAQGLELLLKVALDILAKGDEKA